MKYWLQAIAAFVCVGALIYGDQKENSLLIITGGLGAIATLIWIMLDYDDRENDKNLGL